MCSSSKTNFFGAYQRFVKLPFLQTPSNAAMTPAPCSEDVPTQKRAAGTRRKKNLKEQFECRKAIWRPAKTQTTRAMVCPFVSTLVTLGLFALFGLQFLDTSHFETAAETILVLPEYRAVLSLCSTCLSCCVVRTCLNVKHTLFKMSLDHVR